MDKVGKKRPRFSYTRQQLKELEEHFLVNPYLTKSPMAQLSVKLNIPESQVKIWFQNRRMREKKKPGIFGR
ncbi:hypothetical protein HELRODRAFT_85680 [Helobdella robusta]|uniref:Homeobox domain-containing protein n=1 Tax=Helobdella robusta TaxID=6412 RepID=T1G615_HELRO|nr:hypothetical protein HELRODRAFT_85680 [Helobdella robusta]ESN97229.1 hypothetical protein HELRODRAFT_85680 [Helobdella robusta]